MGHHRPSQSYSGPGSPPPASRSSASSRGILPLHPTSVSMAQQPLAPLHPPLPMHYRAPPDRRSQTPITLPPLRPSDGYTTDSGRREVRLPGFSEFERSSYDQSYHRYVRSFQKLNIAVI